jgi:2-dehydropantoate 2-reductase
MNTSPKILLVGAGAVGSFYCGKLHQAGAEVTAVVRSDYDEVLGNGFTVKSCLGDFHYMPRRVLRSADEYTEQADFIVVATKVLPGIDVPSLIRPAVHGGASIVLLQNGIDIETNTAAAFPENEIISGLAFICVSRSSAGHMDHQDYGRVVVGRYPGGNSVRADLLGEMFTKSGLNCEVVNDIVTARWRKLLWNAPFNPMSVLSGGADTRQMLSRPEARDLARAVMEEVRLLADAAGFPLPAEAVDRNIEDTIKMTPYKTSMLLDYENGRELEVEAILGNASRLGKKLGVRIPHIDTFYALLSQVNDKITAEKFRP